MMFIYLIVFSIVATFNIQYDKMSGNIIINHEESSISLDDQQIFSLTNNVFNSTSQFMTFIKNHNTTIDYEINDNIMHIDFSNIIFNINLYFNIIIDSFNNTVNELRFDAIQKKLDEIDTNIDDLKNSIYHIQRGSVNFTTNGTFINGEYLFRWPSNNVCECFGEKIIINGTVWYDLLDTECVCTIKFFEDKYDSFVHTPKMIFNSYGNYYLGYTPTPSFLDNYIVNLSGQGSQYTPRAYVNMTITNREFILYMQNDGLYDPRGIISQYVDWYAFGTIKTN